MKQRYDRQAKNESLLREVNERLAGLGRKGDDWADDEELFEFLCECGAPGACDGRVRMRLEEYDGVRQQDDRFALVPGHETDDLEDVVERTDRYVIVDKVPEAEPFVRDDPRGAPSH